MLGKLILSIAVILIVSRLFVLNSGSRQDDRRLLVLAFILLVPVFGCRNAEIEVGNDIFFYYQAYLKAISSDNLLLYISDTYKMEKGYLMINWLFSRIIEWPQFILFFEAFFCCGIMLRFIYKYSDDVLLSVLGFMSLGIMGFFLTGFRQSMAISVCLLALEMSEKKKWISFFLLVLFAMSLHQSAVVFLPVYVIMQLKTDRFFVLTETVLLLLAGPFIPAIINAGNEVFERDYSGTYAGSILGGMINIAIGIFVVVIMLYQLGYSNISDDESFTIGQSILIWNRSSGNVTSPDEVWSSEGIKYRRTSGDKFLYILILGIGLYVMRYQALVLERVSFYFTSVIFILLPEVIRNNFTEKDGRLLKMLFIFAMLFLIYMRFGSDDYVAFWNTATI